MNTNIENSKFKIFFSKFKNSFFLISLLIISIPLIINSFFFFELYKSNFLMVSIVYVISYGLVHYLVLSCIKRHFTILRFSIYQMCLIVSIEIVLSFNSFATESLKQSNNNYLSSIENDINANINNRSNVINAYNKIVQSLTEDEDEESMVDNVCYNSTQDDKNRGIHTIKSLNLQTISSDSQLLPIDTKNITPKKVGCSANLIVGEVEKLNNFSKEITRINQDLSNLERKRIEAKQPKIINYFSKEYLMNFIKEYGMTIGLIIALNIFMSKLFLILTRINNHRLQDANHDADMPRSLIISKLLLPKNQIDDSRNDSLFNKIRKKLRQQETSRSFLRKLRVLKLDINQDQYLIEKLHSSNFLKSAKFLNEKELQKLIELDLIDQADINNYLFYKFPCTNIFFIDTNEFDDYFCYNSRF